MDLFSGGEGFWTTLLEGLASYFLGPSPDLLRQTMEAIYNDTPPDLAADAFMRQYRLMWGVASIIAIPLLSVQLIQALTTNGAGKLRDFVHLVFTVIVLGHLGVAVLWVFQQLSGFLSELALLTAGEGDGFSWFEQVAQLPAIGGPSALILGMIQTGANIVLQVEAFVIQYSLIIVGSLIVLAAVLGFAGKFGESVRNAVVGLCAVTLFSPPLMILVLSGGTRVTELVGVPAVPIGLAAFKVFILGLAAYVPFFVYKQFVKRYVHVLSTRSDASGNDNPRSSGGSTVLKTAALAAGAGAALMKVVNTSSTPPQAGGSRPTTGNTSTARRIAYTALSSAGVQAAAKAHPYLAVGAQVAAFVVKPREKPPTAQQQGAPRPPQGPRPQQPKAPAGPRPAPQPTRSATSPTPQSTGSAAIQHHKPSRFAR